MTVNATARRRIEELRYELRRATNPEHVANLDRQLSHEEAKALLSSDDAHLADVVAQFVDDHYPSIDPAKLAHNLHHAFNRVRILSIDDLRAALAEVLGPDARPILNAAAEQARQNRLQA